LGSVDSAIVVPVAGNPSMRSLHASGWAVSTVSGLPVMVEITLDGTSIAQVKGFSARPDVAAAFGRSDFEMSGWNFSLVFGPVQPGNHQLVVRAVNPRGDVVVLPGARAHL
jgi:hypothetical protein